MLGPQAPAGLAWTAGNPAALALEVSVPGSHAAVSASGRSGVYRRPLDPGTEEDTQVMSVGWTPLGRRAAAAGTVGGRWLTQRSPVFANVEEPYTSSPYVVMDTTGTDLRVLGATVEGALSGRFGNWALGLALGARTAESRTLAASVPRTWRTAEPGASVGVVRTFRDGALRVGVHGRTKRVLTTINIFALGAPTRVIPLEMFTEPAAFDLTAGGYFVRIERTERLAGIGAAGESAGVAWTMSADAGRLGEEQYNETSNDPTLDLWTSDVVTTALRLQHARGRADLHADFGWRRLEGDAHRGDLEGVTFSAAESDLHGALHARVAVGAGVALLVQAGLGREERTRRDRLERRRVEIEAWVTQLAAGVEASPSTSLRVAAGAGFARYGPTGGLPDPLALGEAVRQFVFPEYSFLSAPADVSSISARVGWVAGAGRLVWLSAGYASTGSKGPFHTNFAIPDGERSAWNLALSIEM